MSHLSSFLCVLRMPINDSFVTSIVILHNMLLRITFTSMPSLQIRALLVLLLHF